MKRATKIFAAVTITIGMVTGATAFATYKHSDSDERAAYMTGYIGHKLDLNDAQKTQLNDLTNKLMALKNDLKPEQPILSDITNLVSAQTLDQDKALAMITNKTTLINQAAPGVVAAFADFLDGLNAEQKTEVLEFLKKKQQRYAH